MSPCLLRSIAEQVPLCHFFWRLYLPLLNRGHQNGCTCCRFGCHLARGFGMGQILCLKNIAGQVLALKNAILDTVPPPLISTRLRVTASPYPRGSIPKMTVPPPPGGTQWTRDTKQDTQTQWQMIHKMTGRLTVSCTASGSTIGGGDGGPEKHPASTAPSSQSAFSSTGWRLRELGWAVKVGKTAVPGRYMSI